jgi:ADP-ribose pyrophosphatase
MRNLPPENAKRVFQGEIFDVWQWEQKLFDGSTATFECIERPDTVSVIAAVGEKIIVQEQEQPDRSAFFSVPGGRVDHDAKDPLAQAKRELLEETGFISDDWEKWRTAQPSHRIVYRAHYFIAHNCRNTQEPQLEAGERIVNKLVTFEEFLRIAADERFRDMALANMLLRLQLNPRECEAFRRLLFPEENPHAVDRV